VVRSGPPNKRMQLTKLRAAPERQDKVPPCAPAGRMDGGTASQLIRSVGRTSRRGATSGSPGRGRGARCRGGRGTLQRPQPWSLFLTAPFQVVVGAAGRYRIRVRESTAADLWLSRGSGVCVASATRSTWDGLGRCSVARPARPCTQRRATPSRVASSTL